MVPVTVPARRARWREEKQVEWIVADLASQPGAPLIARASRHRVIHVVADGARVGERRGCLTAKVEVHLILPTSSGCSKLRESARQKSRSAEHSPSAQAELVFFWVGQYQAPAGWLVHLTE